MRGRLTALLCILLLLAGSGCSPYWGLGTGIGVSVPRSAGAADTELALALDLYVEEVVSIAGVQNIVNTNGDFYSIPYVAVDPGIVSSIAFDRGPALTLKPFLGWAHDWQGAGSGLASGVYVGMISGSYLHVSIEYGFVALFDARENVHMLRITWTLQPSTIPEKH